MGDAPGLFKADHLTESRSLEVLQLADHFIGIAHDHHVMLFQFGIRGVLRVYVHRKDVAQIFIGIQVVLRH
jgi:hypothetical protein